MDAQETARNLYRINELLREQLTTFKTAYLGQVDLHNKTLDELAICQKERVELYDALSNLLSSLRGEVRTKDINAWYDSALDALAKVGKGE